MSIKLDNINSINLNNLSKQNTKNRSYSEWELISEAKINNRANDKIKYFFKSEGKGSLEVVIKRYNHIPQIFVLHLGIKNGFVEHADKGYNLKSNGKETSIIREPLIQKGWIENKNVISEELPLDEALKYIQPHLRKQYKPLKKALEYLQV